MNQQKPSKILNHIHKSYDLPVYAYDAWLVFLQGFCWIAYEKAQCFYHSDHASTSLSTGLGSASWITVRQAHCNADLNGDAIQHLQYLPFGEDFVNQQSTAFDTRFKFTGKEKDSETGYSYFGARYYDSDLSVWLSVDPLADKYPSMSAYMYTAGNPVMLVDPDGREFDDPKDEQRARDSQEEARTRVTELNTTVKDLESRTDLNDAEKQTLADSKSQVSILENHIQNIEDMINTKNYKYKYNKHDGSGDMAGTYVDKNGVINMEYIEGRADKQAHEETHGHQYITGELKIVNGIEDFSYSDLNDEAKAYQVEYSYKNADEQSGFRIRLGVDAVRGVNDITPANLAKSPVIQKYYKKLVKDFNKTQNR